MSKNNEPTLPVKRVQGDTMEERLTANAYNRILPERYLNKDEQGDVVEAPEELFERVAKNVALPEMLYVDEEVMLQPEHLKASHPDKSDILDDVFAGGPVETPVTQENIKWVSYDAIIDDLPADARSAVEETAAEFQELMERLSFIPNSPTLMNAGDTLQQLSACFVDSPTDDLTDIHETVKEAAETFQMGGGMGYAFWKLRPRGDPVGSTGGISSGPITFMRTYDQACATIAQGGVRRGAQMGVMKVSHPDVLEFIHAKNKDVSLMHSLMLNDPDDYTHSSFSEALEEARELVDEDGKVPPHLRNAVEGHLSNFNVSVGITDDFMEALENGEEFTFTNPRTGEPHVATAETAEMYDVFGLGEYVEEGDVLSVPAQELWDDIVEGAYQNGEPGVIFLDRINDEHSFDVEEYPEHEILATNPCAEQPMQEYEACNLGHINLSTIVSKDRQIWPEFETGTSEDTDVDTLVQDFLGQAIDWDEMDQRIHLGARFLDNVVTMSAFPVEEMEETVRNLRKTGLGIMGLAQLYIQLGVRYGSAEANEIARQVMTYINHESKAVSHQLAEERGRFGDWDESKYADPVQYADWFEKQTGLPASQWEDGFPIRNHNTTTIAPTGTTSMLGNTTGGCEPIYNVAYYKNVSDDVQGDEMLVEFDDYFLRTLEANDINVEMVKQEAQEQMATNTFDGVSGLETVPSEIGDLFVVTGDLSGKEHASVQCACQDGVDSAISKTCNFPNSATKEDMEEVYQYIYEHGGKGVTVYRDGTRSKQVLTTRADNTEFSEDMDDDEAATHFVQRIEERFGSIESFLARDDVDTPVLSERDGSTRKKPRPDTLVGVTQCIETGYGNVYITINADPETKNPFELFVNIGSSGGYTNSFADALAKAISVSLRSGVNPQEIIEKLRGIRSPKVAFNNGQAVHSIPDAFAISMENYLDGDFEAVEHAEINNNNKEAGKDESGHEWGTEQRTTTESTLLERGENPECPDCNEFTLAMNEGCKTCQSCGWSEC